MKKAVLALIIVAGLALVPASLFAQEVNWEGLYHKGDFSLEVGVGFGYHGVGYGLAVLPGAEWTVQDWKIGDVVPLAFGVTAKGFVEFVPGDSGSSDEIVHNRRKGGRIAQMEIRDLVDGHIGNDGHGSDVDTFIGVSGTDGLGAEQTSGRRIDDELKHQGFGAG